MQTPERRAGSSNEGMTGTYSIPAQGVVAGAEVRAEAWAIKAAEATAGMSGTGLTRAQSQEEVIGVIRERRGDCPGLITRGLESMT